MNTENSKENIKDDEHIFQTVKAKEVVLKPNYKFFPTNYIYRFFTKIGVFFALVFSQTYGRLILGYRIRGKKNLRKIKEGKIIVANHVHPLDSFMLTTSFYPKRFYVTSLKSNMGLPFGIGKLFNFLGAIPIPDTSTETIRFIKQMKGEINKKHNIVIFPEAALWPYCDHIREFKKGAVRFAIMTDAPIIPMVWTFHKPRFLRKLVRINKPVMHLNVLEPYYIKKEGTSKDIIDNSTKELHDIISNYFNENNEFKYVNKKMMVNNK